MDEDKMPEIDRIRLERDLLRARVNPLEDENSELRSLLELAQEAIMSEYRARMHKERRSNEHPNDYRD